MKTLPCLFATPMSKHAGRSVPWSGKWGFPSQGFGSAVEFLAAVGPMTLGCAITEIELPDMCGLELLPCLREQNAMPLVLLSNQIDLPLAVRALKLGFIDVIEKRNVHSLLRRAVHEGVDRHVTLQLEMEQRKRVEEQFAKLTPRERSVLTLVVSGKPNKLIAKKLGISMRTVEARRARIYHKLNVRTVAELVSLVESRNVCNRTLMISADHDRHF